MNSKTMTALLAELTNKQADAQKIVDKADATESEINAARQEIKAVKARIETQRELDEGKEFDAKGEEMKDMNPVNEPVYAQPNTHKGPFNTFGEQLSAIVKSSRGGAPIDNRLLEIQNATGASEGVPSEGGFLVQQDFSAQLLQDVYATGALANKCQRFPVSANSNGMKINGVDETSRADGSRYGGVQGYWAAEAATVTASQPKFRQINLNLNKLMALYYATDELLQDASAMESVLSKAFADEIRFKLDNAIFLGDGAGKPLGVMNAGCLVTQAKESGQAADTIIYENIVNMWSRLVASSRPKAVWYINQECEPQLESMAMSIGTGGQLSPLAIEYMTKGTIKGAPVVPIEHASAIGDLGDIVLADMSQYLLIDKGGMQTASSMHVKFLYDEMAFRVTYRVDGQPMRASAIQPFKGTAGRTLSSFVTLQAR